MAFADYIDRPLDVNGMVPTEVIAKNQKALKYDISNNINAWLSSIAFNAEMMMSKSDGRDTQALGAKIIEYCIEIKSFNEAINGSCCY